MNTKYRVKKERFLNGIIEARAGDVVYSCMKPDYGCARDDSDATGILHMSVTNKADGDYPFFTIPVGDLEPTP